MDLARYLMSTADTRSSDAWYPPRLNDHPTSTPCNIIKIVKNTRLPRTSTPIPEFASSFRQSDSVNDFFYNSWKNDLHSEDSRSSQSSRPLSPIFDGPEPNRKRVTQNIYYYNQPIYLINPLVSVQMLTPVVCPIVGYRPDGTYGIIPDCWAYCV